MKKPCIQCGNECEILPVQLGDIFTLTFLRICSPECMFMEAYDYIYEMGYHKHFRNKLYDKQNEEDAAERKEYVDQVTEESLKMMRKHLEANPNLLSTPAPQNILKTFEGVPPIPQCSGQTIRFTRPTKQEKIRWQKERVDRLKTDLYEALKELEELKNV